LPTSRAVILACCRSSATPRDGQQIRATSNSAGLDLRRRSRQRRSSVRRRNPRSHCRAPRGMRPRLPVRSFTPRRAPPPLHSSATSSPVRGCALARCHARRSGSSLLIGGVAQGRMHFSSFFLRQARTHKPPERTRGSRTARDNRTDTFGLDRADAAASASIPSARGSPQQVPDHPVLADAVAGAPGSCREGFDPLTEVRFDHHRRTRCAGQPDPPASCRGVSAPGTSNRPRIACPRVSATIRQHLGLSVGPVRRPIPTMPRSDSATLQQRVPESPSSLLYASRENQRNRSAINRDASRHLRRGRVEPLFVITTHTSGCLLGGSDSKTNKLSPRSRPGSAPVPIRHSCQIIRSASRCVTVSERGFSASARTNCAVRAEAVPLRLSRPQPPGTRISRTLLAQIFAQRCLPTPLFTGKPLMPLSPRE